MKDLKKADLENKSVLVRVDFNVPLKNGKILDETRIKIALPTISYLLRKTAKVILISHLGRPKGREVSALRLEKVSQRLQKLLGFQNKILKKRLNGFLAYQISENLYLLENIRFYREEEENNPSFAKTLASLGSLFVNEAFSCSHRNHASTEGITHFLPSFPGFYFKKEFETLSHLSKSPKRPFVSILGGAKVSDKLRAMENLSKKVDWFLLGGVMANTFLAALGLDLKDSIFSQEKLKEAKEILNQFGQKIILPSELVFGNLQGKRMVLDIGESEVKKFSQYIKKAKTIFWNGNLGMTEIKKYRKGSEGIAKAIIGNKKALSIVSGGDTLAFLNQIGLSQFSFLSQGGGATLEFLSGKKFDSLKNLL